MNTKNMIGMVVAVVIGLIMIGPLVSVITNAQTDLGTPITKTNVSLEQTLDEIQGNYTITYAPATDTLTINDVVATISTSWNTVFILDTGYMEINTTNDTIRFIHFDDASAVSTLTGDVEISLTDGEYTVSGTVSNVSTTFTGTYSKGFVMSPTNEGEYGITNGYASNLGKAFTNKTPKWIIAADVTALDEFLYYDGTLSKIGDDEIVVTITSGTIVEGTTDIYSGNSLTVTKNGETATGYMRVVIPMEVQGHATSGTMYDLLDIIPILVTVGLVLGVVGVAFSRRE